MTTQNITSNALPPRLLIDAITTCCEIKQPVFTWGPPGVGKSQIHQQVCERLFDHCDPNPGGNFIDFRAVLRDVIDLKGLPDIDRTNGKSKTHWAIPDFLPSDGEGLLFIDELPQAPQLVQNGLSSLILDRRIDDYVLPDGWSIAAAGNNETDRAATVKMPTHIANRFVHLQFALDIDDWIRHAATHDFRPEVYAFIKFRPQLLHMFDPKSGDKAFPTPRSWEFASKILDADPAKEIELPLYAGTVGQGAAAEFTGFLRVFRSLPNPDAVIMDPHNAVIPDQPATVWALCGALSRQATDANFGNVYAYADRLDDEFTAFLMLSCIRRDPTLQQSKPFIEFGAKYQGIMF